jgi:hypothetical protein
MSRNGRKVTDELDNLKLYRIPHPLYSQDLSLSDFWLSGMLKHKIKDREFQTIETIMTTVHRGWNEPGLENLQFVFFNWIERFESAIKHKGAYYTKQDQKII